MSFETGELEQRVRKIWFLLAWYMVWKR